MKTIKLKVTSKVLEQVTKAKNQEQIAISSKSDIVNVLSGATKSNRIQIQLCGVQALWVGDTHAIWRAHNNYSEEEFDALFNFLSSKPDTEFEFLCEFL